jgi:hypothetical protein
VLMYVVALALFFACCYRVSLFSAGSSGACG